MEEFHPEAIYLFGSHAWGTPTEDSDVDLFVIVRESTEKPLHRAQRAHRCLIGLNFPKDVLVRTRAEVEEGQQIPSSVTSSVLRKGRRIYG
ncbi:MAG: nucleotidyltransferase domain-containing protein [Verrucomicrobiae bacterium]|nr:nucleotidyltransferase domain-containing protein [Verrucomicrobiae bacterium]